MADGKPGLTIAKSCVLILFAVALVVCGCGKKPRLAAERAVARFHMSYNREDLDGIWAEADPQFRMALTKQKYDEFMEAVELKLGKATATSNIGWRVKSVNLRTTVLMTQKTIFEKGEGTESFTLAVEGTNAMLVRYSIQSTDLILK